MTKEEKLRKALSRAFRFGSDHCYYEESEYPTYQRKAFIVMEKYKQFVDETIKEISDGN